MNDPGEGGGARLLDGRAIAQEMLAETRRDITDILARRGFTPEIRVVLVGEDAASAIYARRILKDRRVGGFLREAGQTARSRRRRRGAAETSGAER